MNGRVLRAVPRELHALISANARLWAGEAEIFSTYFASSRRSAATDAAWLARQCYKELFDGVVARIARLAQPAQFDLAPALASRALADAVASTLESLDTDQLLGALSQLKPLPFTIEFNRIAGVRANVNGGSDKLLKGGVKLSAVWSDYGDPVDLSDMTIADFADRILNGGEGLADTADSIVTITGEAYQELDAMF